MKFTETFLIAEGTDETKLAENIEEIYKLAQECVDKDEIYFDCAGFMITIMNTSQVQGLAEDTDDEYCLMIQPAEESYV